MTGSKLFNAKRIGLAAAALMLAAPLSGCVLVGGYRSGGGFFIWPGSLALFVVALLLLFIFRRR